MNNYECPREPGAAEIFRVGLLVIVALLPAIAVAESEAAIAGALLRAIRAKT
jgi:hypothetical protein